MPVIGFTAEPLNDTDSKHLTTFGKLTGMDTTSTVSTLNPNGETWAVNDALYMSTTAGGLTKVRPTGGTTLIQRIAKVLKVDATGGQIFVFNTARTAGLPNLGTDKLWIGDANGIPQKVDKSTIGGASIYTADDTIGSGRKLTITDNVTIVGSSSNNVLNIANNGEMQFSAGGNMYGKMFTNGDWALGGNTIIGVQAGITLHRNTLVKGEGTGSADNLFQVLNSTNNAQFKIFGNGSIILGGTSFKGSEKISIQGRTGVFGADTWSTSTAFEIYDGDTTPTKLWDFRNNGDLIGSGPRKKNTIVKDVYNYKTNHSIVVNFITNLRPELSTLQRGNVEK